MVNPQSLLVVDDDGAMRQMLASLFEEAGYRVSEAASSDDALDQAGEAEFDAVWSGSCASCGPTRRSS
jgi:CheY-like chemotaxis protein